MVNSETTRMPFISSPVAYPATSSPTAEQEYASKKAESPRKKRKISRDDGAVTRPPLGNITVNTQSASGHDPSPSPIKPGTSLIGGFIVDDEGDDDAQLSSVSNLERAKSSLDKHAESRLQTNDVSGSQAGFSGTTVPLTTCSGRVVEVHERTRAAPMSYEQLIASRSSKAPNSNAQKAYYGIDIQTLIQEAKTKAVEAANEPTVESSVEVVVEQPAPCKAKTLLWTEKYRARKFTDLVGDERTHRSVLRWLKAWDPIVFPHQAKAKPKLRSLQEDQSQERQHRKVLLLTGPPGLGKTTLAHVCAKQAGYEVQEINASDERNRDVVKGRVRDMVATENVKSVGGANNGTKKVVRPVCVVVDEVDGVVSGSGGSGEGGFVKALTDLLALDQKNSAAVLKSSAVPEVARKKKKGDNFRLLRPLILICNDVYHPSLRLLRQGTFVEIIHVRKPALTMVVPRLQSIFEREGLACDGDGVRRLCETAWGISSRKEDAGSSSGTSEGDVRSVLVIGEWVAAKFRACNPQSETRMSRRWLETNVLGDLAHGGGAARSLGRGGSKEVVDRVFQVNAGFPQGSTKSATSKNTSASLLSASDTAHGLTEAARQTTHARLREMVDSTGEDERVMTDLFSTYPTQPFQDDTTLTKPCAAYDWLYFHERVSHLVHAQQEWEMAPYLSSPVIAFHHLFASAARKQLPNFNKNDTTEDETKVDTPFSGPRASFEAHEALKEHTATLSHLHSSLALHLHRAFRSPSHIATELTPYALKLLNPDVKPVVVGGADKSTASVRRAAEKEMVVRAASSMLALGISFQKTRIETDAASIQKGPINQGGWVYRMDPPLDSTGAFETLAKANAHEKVRFAVRQVIEAEYRKQTSQREAESRHRRAWGDDFYTLNENPAKKSADVQDQIKADRKVKRDFFGRPVLPIGGMDSERNAGDDNVDGRATNIDERPRSRRAENDENRIWVSYNEGFSNAVRKPITMKELLAGL